MTVIPAVGRWEAGDQEFKAILGYVESSGPAWDSGDPVSKKQNKKQFTCGKSVLLETNTYETITLTKQLLQMKKSKEIPKAISKWLR